MHDMAMTWYIRTMLQSETWRYEHIHNTPQVHWANLKTAICRGLMATSCTWLKWFNRTLQYNWSKSSLHETLTSRCIRVVKSVSQSYMPLNCRDIALSICIISSCRVLIILLKLNVAQSKLAVVLIIWHKLSAKYLCQDYVTSSQ